MDNFKFVLLSTAVLWTFIAYNYNKVKLSLRSFGYYLSVQHGVSPHPTNTHAKINFPNACKANYRALVNQDRYQGPLKVLLILLSFCRYYPMYRTTLTNIYEGLNNHVN